MMSPRRYLGRNKNIEPFYLTYTTLQPNELHHLEPRRKYGGGRVRIKVTTIDHGILHSVAKELFGDEQDGNDEKACKGRLDAVAKKEYEVLVKDPEVRKRAKEKILSVRKS